MKLRLLTGFLVITIALILQFFLARAGIYFNLSFAALISFAFVFGFWELLLLVLAAAFVLNWQPAVSGEILMISLFPLAVYFLRNIIHWQKLPMNALAIFLGFLLLYVIAGTGGFSANIKAFIMDLIAGELFAGIVFFPHKRWENI